MTTNTICSIVHYLHLKSVVSVVFDFNASLNDALPVSLMLFSVDLMIIERVDC